METITEDYVSFEIAKLLKKKGFNELTTKAYPYFEGKDYKYDISCPTLQMAMKWLREVHNLFIQVWILSEQGYWFNIDKLSDNYNHKGLYSTGLEDIYYPTYEEACEAAIKYCLENLI